MSAEPTPAEDDLALLSKTIAEHAREIAGKEWSEEYRSALMSVLQRAGLGNSDKDMLSVGDRDIPIKVLIEAIHAQFLDVRVRALKAGLARQIVTSAMRKLEDE